MQISAYDIIFYTYWFILKLLVTRTQGKDDFMRKPRSGPSSSWVMLKIMIQSQGCLKLWKPNLVGSPHCFVGCFIGTCEVAQATNYPEQGKASEGPFPVRTGLSQSWSTYAVYSPCFPPIHLLLSPQPLVPTSLHLCSYPPTVVGSICCLYIFGSWAVVVKLSTSCWLWVFGPCPCSHPGILWNKGHLLCSADRSSGGCTAVIARFLAGTRVQISIERDLSSLS